MTWAAVLVVAGHQLACTILCEEQVESGLHAIQTCTYGTPRWNIAWNYTALKQPVVSLEHGRALHIRAKILSHIRPVQAYCC